MEDLPCPQLSRITPPDITGLCPGLGAGLGPPAPEVGAGELVLEVLFECTIRVLNDGLRILLRAIIAGL
jgi:hypothetical protein